MFSEKRVYTLWITVILLSGCAERGYVLSTQVHTSVVNAQAQIDKSKDESSIFDKMVDAVFEKQQKSTAVQEVSQDLVEEGIDQITNEDQAVLQNKQSTIEKQAKSYISNQLYSTISIQSKSNSTSKKSAILGSKDETDELLRVANEPKEATKRKKAQKHSDLKQAANKAVQNNEVQYTDIATKQEQKYVLLRIEKESKDQAKRDIYRRMKTETPKEVYSAQSIKKEAGTKHETKKRDLPYAKSMLRFIPVDKTFVKFGTSEIHGHVIYLKDGKNIPLYRPVAYLIPKNSISRYWFKHYYLKNAMPREQVVLTFVDKSEIDFENNFSFYGVAKGSYYVVIVAKNPHQLSQSIVIAKNIDVDKFKKVIAVFSKKVE